MNYLVCVVLLLPAIPGFVSAAIQVQTQVIHTNTPELEGEFGRCVALGGGVLAVGSDERNAPGAEQGRVSVYQVDGSGQWQLVQEIKRASHFIYGAGTFASKVVIVGDSMMIEGQGGPACWEYQRVNDMWEPYQELPPPQLGVTFNGVTRLAYDGTTFITGYQNAGGGPGGIGRVLFWKRNGGFWELDRSFAPGQLGLPTQEGIAFARSLAVHGQLAAVGAARAAVQGVDRAGAVSVFRNVLGVWQHEQTLVRPGTPDRRHEFGATVEIRDDYLFIGCSRAIGDSSAVYVYRDLPGQGWTFESTISATLGFNGVPWGLGFGTTLRFIPPFLAVSAPGHTVPSSQPGGPTGGIGSVLVFERCGDIWNQLLGLTSPYELGSANLGLAPPGMDFDGTRIVAGAPYYIGTAFEQGAAAVIDFNPSVSPTCTEIGRIACVPADPQTPDCPCGAPAEPSLGCPNSFGLGAHLALQGQFDQVAIRRAVVSGVPPGSMVLLAAGRPHPGPPVPGLPFGAGILCLPAQVTRAMGTAGASGDVVFDYVPGPVPAGGGTIFFGMSLPYQAVYRTPTPEACGEVWNSTNAVLLLHRPIQ